MSPLVLDGPMKGEIFRAYVEQMLAPALSPGNVVVLDNLAARKVAGVEEAIRIALADNSLPAEKEIRGIPGWAFDLCSREGRAAFNAFLRTDSDTAWWICAHIPPAQRMSFLGGIVFRVEGGGVRSRLRWRQADVLRKLVDIGSHGAHCPDASEILDLMRADMPLLNQVRADVL